MRHFVLIAIALIAAPAFAQQPPGGVADTPKLSSVEEKAKIHLPPGFELQLVASDPDIRKPMNICFDPRGRIWMTDTIEYPWPVPPGKTGRDRILILDDFDAHGKARKITTFADGLNIPIGILPYQDGCIAFSIPNLWFFRDTDGDGKADEKKVLYGPFDHVDTHGNVNSLTIGFDGWLYACHGYRNDSHVKGTDGQVLHLNSGNVFRMKLDGSHCESFTRGQVNPFGLAWDPLGNLYSACCHSRPLTQLLRGGVYESFSKPHDGLGFAPHMNEFGQEHSTGLCGLVHYSADQFPGAYHGKLFMGDVVLNRINSYRIEHNGSSPKAIHEKFLVSDDPWFRPVDLRLGPDGAIYLADFYNCIIGHYEVPLTHPKRDRDSGRIWRIVWKGEDSKAPAPERPYGDLAKEPIAKLTDLLGHANLTVRMQAMHELASRGDAVKGAMTAALKSESVTQLTHAMWVLERIGALSDESLIVIMGDHRQTAEMARIHAARLLAERKKLTAEQRNLLLDWAKTALPMLRRCALDALGRHPDATTLLALLEAGIPRNDTHLAHAYKMAVRDHLKVGLLWDKSPRDFTQFGKEIAEALPGAPSPEAAKFLLELLGDVQVPGEIEFIARHGDDHTVGRLIATAEKTTASDDVRLEWFRAVQRGIQARGKALPKSAVDWADRLADTLLAHRAPQMRQAGAELVASVRLSSKLEQLKNAAANVSESIEPRAAAFAALVVLDPAKHVTTCGNAVRDASAPSALRERVARTLGTLNRPEARQELVNSFTTVPAALASQIAIGLAATPAGSEDLIAAVTAGKASPRLLLERPVQSQLRQHRLPKLDERLAKLTAGLPPVDEKMNQLIRARLSDYMKSNHDLEAGAKVYVKHCAACHQLGGQGAKVGPQLDGIGARSAERLLEDMLDPNRNVDPAFRSSRLTLKDGRDLQGLVLREEGEVVVMADNQGKEVRVEKKQIEERTISPLSPMPANWGDIIPAKELNELLAYLASKRAK